MIQSGFEILGREFPKALIETLQMMAISMAVSAVFGLLLGFVLFLTSSPLFFRNRFVNAVSGAVVNVIRSIPFVILMVFCLPLAKALVGTKIGPLAASVPLSIAAVAFQARLVEGALREVDQGVLEAAAGSGAGFWLIVRRVLLTEAAPGLVRFVPAPRGVTGSSFSHAERIIKLTSAADSGNTTRAAAPFLLPMASLKYFPSILSDKI